MFIYVGVDQCLSFYNELVPMKFQYNKPNTTQNYIYLKMFVMVNGLVIMSASI